MNVKVVYFYESSYKCSLCHNVNFSEAKECGMHEPSDEPVEFTNKFYIPNQQCSNCISCEKVRSVESLSAEVDSGFLHIGKGFVYFCDTSDECYEIAVDDILKLFIDDVEINPKEVLK